MSSIAKTLVVVVLVLSLAYVALNMTLVSHEANWYHKSIELTGQMHDLEQQKNQEIDTLTGLNERWKADYNSKVKEVAKLDGQIEKLSGDLKKGAIRIGQLTAQRDGVTQKLNQMAKDYQRDSRRLEELDKAYSGLQRANGALKASYAKLEDNVNNLEVQLELSKRSEQQLRKRHEALDQRVTELDSEINLYRSVYGILPSSITPAQSAAPAIRTHVLAVSDDPDLPLVVLGAGSKDGVKPGYSFMIYRGTEYLGKVVAEKVQEDVTGARIVPGFTPKGARISDGDSATTRFSY